MKLKIKTIKAALKKWGQDHNLIKTTEELSELAQALCKVMVFRLHNGSSTPDLTHVAEEIADVEMCLQILKYGLELDEPVKQQKEQKIERLLKRLES